jgi:ABC-type transporter Mla subunit MlaD
MAQLTAKEFEDVVSLIANHLRLDRLHEKLLKANALVSRKRPPSVQALAGQLYQLSAGLRRNHPARYAVELLWQEMLAEQVKEEHGKTLETLADRINVCLTEKLEVVPEKSADLISALGSYHQAVAALTNDEVAYLEVLMRASADVAQFLREHQADVLAAGAAAPPAPETASTTEAAPTESSPTGTETPSES